MGRVPEFHNRNAVAWETVRRGPESPVRPSGKGKPGGTGGVKSRFCALFVMTGPAAALEKIV